MIITFCAESPRIMHAWKPLLPTTVIRVSSVMREDAGPASGTECPNGLNAGEEVLLSRMKAVAGTAPNWLTRLQIATC